MTLTLPRPAPSAAGSLARDPAPAVSSRARPRSADDALATLLTGAPCGPEDPFAELYRLTRARVYAAVLRVVRCPELAGEVTQEAYLEIWQQRARYRRDKASVLSWMTMIARRRAVDRVRSVTRSLALERRWSLDHEALLTLDGWDEVTARLYAHQIRQTLSTLSAVQREALTLVYLEQRTMAEVAGLLGVPLATVKSRSREGLSRLRALLNDPSSAATLRR